MTARAIAAAAVLGALLAAAPASAALPVRALTPGAVATTDLAAVCAPRYATRHRRVSAKTKRKVFAAYHIAPAARRGYRIDHLVPLELGGANSILNLWPQLRADSDAKDVVERELHERVCSGRMALPDAQRAIERDWTTAVPR